MSICIVSHVKLGTCISPGKGLPQSWTCCCKPAVILSTWWVCNSVFKCSSLIKFLCYLLDLTGGPVFCWSDPQCWCLNELNDQPSFTHCVILLFVCCYWLHVLMLFGLKRHICTDFKWPADGWLFSSSPPPLHLGMFILLFEYGSNSTLCYSAAETKVLYSSHLRSDEHVCVCFQLW